MHQNLQKQSTFVPALESLRGIAALFVAIYHSFEWVAVHKQPISVMSIFEVDGIQAWLARGVLAVTNGPSWVDIFFVLSGYVLALSIKGQKLSLVGWRAFMTKRVLRIAPAYLATLTFISIVLIARAETGGLSDAFDWYPRWSAANLTVHELLLNASFVQTWMNPPAWTLRIELLAALFFPLLFFASQKLSAAGNASLLILLVICGCYTLLKVDVMWIYFMSLFLVGVMCFRFGPAIVSRLPNSTLSIAVLLSFAVIILPNLFFITLPLVRELPAAIGGFMLIAILASDRDCFGVGWFKSKFPRFLGKVSFSFYLLHYMVLYLTTSVITHYFGFGWLSTEPLLVMIASAVISISICLPMSWVLFCFVERPFANIGRKISGQALAVGNAPAI